MKTISQTKEVVLTKSQYEARKTAGTLVSGRYKIKGKSIEVNTTAPTSSTTGHVGQFYLNTTDNKLYICAAISEGVYTWVDTNQTEIDDTSTTTNKTWSASKLNTTFNTKQPTLVSGTNIKTVNGNSLLGSGDVTIAQTEAEVVQTTGTATDKVMSQKAVTDFVINRGNTVNAISNFCILKPGSFSTLTTLDTYTADQVHFVSWLQRPLCFYNNNFNHYKSYPLVSLYKNNQNYLSYEYAGYSIILKNVVNNTIVNTQTLLSFSASGGDINSSAAEYCEIDYDRKYLVSYCYKNGVLTKLYEFDFSSWDLSHLDTFNIKTGMGFCNFETATMNLRINFKNTPTMITDLLTQKIQVGQYNCFDFSNYLAPRSIETKISFGGTRTLDERHHVIGTGSQTSLAYYTMGVLPYVSELTGRCGFSFRIKLLSGNMKIANGANQYHKPRIYDADYNFVCELATTAYSFDLVVGTEYIIYCATVSDLGYAGLYNFYAQGDFEVELWDDKAYPIYSCNYCSETFDVANNIYCGSIPCSSTNNDYALRNILGTYTSANPSDIPYLGEYGDTSGNLYKYTGTVWKQINNS